MTQCRLLGFNGVMLNIKQSDLMVGDIVVANDPKFGFERYEGTVMQVTPDFVAVKWVYDDKDDWLEYGLDEVRHIS